jgi:colanic acid biosynthesis glycosyl transferase WcaI
MDVFPQEMVEFGLLKRDSTLTRVLYRVSSRAFRHAAAVIVIGRCMADRVAAMGVSRDRIHFIPNWVDERKLHPVEASANRVRADYGWQGKCVILYGGNVGNAQYFEDFVEVAGQMRELPDLLFAIVGDGSRRAEIESRVRSKGLDNLVMLPFLHDKYPLSDILAAADVHFISLREACTGLGVPSKTYAALAVGRPVIYQGSPEGEIARMITEESIGEVVRPGAVSELRAVVAAYHGDRERRRREGARARALAEGKYGHQRALEQYANLFERVAGRQRGAT